MTAVLSVPVKVNDAVVVDVDGIGDWVRRLDGVVVEMVVVGGVVSGGDPEHVPFETQVSTTFILDQTDTPEASVILPREADWPWLFEKPFFTPQANIWSGTANDV